MAGVKGKSGGARKNAGGARANSGGARAGAGRKPKPAPEPAVVGQVDPLEFLQGVMRGEIDATPLQVRAAVAAAQYVHSKKGEGGKREEQAGAAKKAAGGRFAPKAPPKLVVSNR